MKIANAPERKFKIRDHILNSPFGRGQVMAYTYFEATGYLYIVQVEDPEEVAWLKASGYGEDGLVVLMERNLTSLFDATFVDPAME